MATGKKNTTRTVYFFRRRFSADIMTKIGEVHRWCSQLVRGINFIVAPSPWDRENMV